MKAILLAVALISFSNCGFCQNIRTVFKNDSLKTTTYSGFGGPFIKATHIRNDWGILMGGKGGVIINRQFVFGGIGEGLVTNNKFYGDNLKGDSNTPLTYSYGAGGVFFEYIFNMENPVHISIPINFMAGGVSVNDYSSEDEIESSSDFIIEPGVSVEFNFSNYFIAAFNVSYRQAFGLTLVNMDDGDISGVDIGLLFKFGSF